MPIVRRSAKEIRKSSGRVNWHKVRTTTDEEIAAQIASDLDTASSVLRNIMRNGARARKTRTTSDDFTVEESSGNVFADLGYPNAEEALTKSRLAQQIAEIIEKRHLTQAQAATLLGIDQPKISKLLRGQLREFSTDRLFRFLNALDQDVEIVIKSKPRSRRQATVSVIAA